MRTVNLKWVMEQVICIIIFLTYIGFLYGTLSYPRYLYDNTLDTIFIMVFIVTFLLIAVVKIYFTLLQLEENILMAFKDIKHLQNQVASIIEKENDNNAILFNTYSSAEVIADLIEVNKRNLQ